jgi:cell division protein FtsQ
VSPPTRTPAHAKAPRRQARGGGEPDAHPRIRERRRAVEHGASRRRRVLLGVAGVVVAVLAISIGLLLSPLLAVEHVTVSGADHTPVGTILAAADLGGHPAMVTLDTGAVERRIDALPWILEATVTRHWPSTVSIDVIERTPVAIVSGASGSPELIDETGRVLAAQADARTLPRVAVGERAGVPGTSLHGAAAALVVAATLPRAFRRQVASIVESRGSVTLSLRVPVRFYLGPPTNLAQKYAAIAAVIAHAQLHVGDVVDVTAPQSVVVTSG